MFRIKWVWSLVLIMTFALEGHALVRLVDQCWTSDGRYEILIVDSHGAGRPRLNNYCATIYDNLGNALKSYSVIYRRMGAANAFRWHFLDSETKGTLFDLAFPSPSLPNTILNAAMDDLLVYDKEVSCVNDGLGQQQLPRFSDVQRSFVNCEMD